MRGRHGFTPSGCRIHGPSQASRALGPLARTHDPIGSIKDAVWQGPHPVPVEDVDSSNRDSWAASSDPDRVAKARRKLRARLADRRHPKPIILVRTLGSDKDMSADGHHRFWLRRLRASRRCGRMSAESTRGRATGMRCTHRSRPRRPGRRCSFSPKRSSPSRVDYRPATTPGRNCGTCDMGHLPRQAG